MELVESGLPDTPSKSLEYANESMFPNIHILLRLICTLPVTSSECERSISVLRRLKTYLHSTIGQENDRASTHAHQVWDGAERG